MADHSLTRRDLRDRRARALPRAQVLAPVRDVFGEIGRGGFPIWLWIAIVYLAGRVVTTGFFWIAATASDAGSRFGADATVGSLLMGWDAQWYWMVAVNGYPTTLPINDVGIVEENAWAFLPLYPVLANAVGALFGSYGVGAILVSLLAGLLSCLALYGLLRERFTTSVAFWATVLFANGPLAALFQVGYAEALGLLWLLLALWAVLRRQLFWLYPLIPLMGYTRPGVLAFSLFLAGYGVWRFFRRRRDPLPFAHVVHIVIAGLFAAAVGLSWQVIAAAVTGSPSAYLATELAWRRGWLGLDHDFAPLAGFWDGSMLWFDLWGLPPWLGIVALAAAVAAAVYALVFSRRVATLGAELRLWTGSYLVYLLLVFFPQTSIFRLLYPLAPGVAVLAVPRSKGARITVLGAVLALQFAWIFVMYARGATYWQIP